MFHEGKFCTWTISEHMTEVSCLNHRWTPSDTDERISNHFVYRCPYCNKLIQLKRVL